MVYRLDAGTVIDAEGNLVIENLYSGSVSLKTQAQGLVSGYNSGSASPNSYSNVIEKFPFSSDANATDVGDLTTATLSGVGQSSGANGYISGGRYLPPSTFTNTIEKFPFSTDANASDVGDLTESKYGASGQSSTSNGYTSGGSTPAASNKIEKFPFSSDANASDIADLLGALYNATGQQV